MPVEPTSATKRSVRMATEKARLLDRTRQRPLQHFFIEIPGLLSDGRLGGGTSMM